MRHSNETANFVPRLEAMLRSEGRAESTVERFAQQVPLILDNLVSWDEDGIMKLIGGTLADTKPSYRRFNFYVMKRMFRLEKIKWPHTDDLKPPRVPRSSIKRVRFSSDEIAQLVGNSNVLNPRDRYYLALSIIYGLRREELTRQRKGDLRGKRILIKVGKGGDPRWHIVPKALHPILSAYDFENPEPIISKKKMSTLFHDICGMCGATTNKGDGWHKIRRALVRALRRAGHPSDDIHNFMRWEQKKDEMVEIYAGELEPEDLKMIDEKILRKHPFLPLWS